jgi:hypothetical protein
LDGCIDCRKHAGHVLEHFVVPKSQNTIAVRFKMAGTHRIGSVVRMLAAIDFDHEFELVAGEVGEVWTNGCLTAKVMLLERWLPQMLPQLLFGFGRVATQASRARHTIVGWTLRSLWHLAPPTPDPSPPRAARVEGGGKIRAR